MQTFRYSLFAVDDIPDADIRRAIEDMVNLGDETPTYFDVLKVVQKKDMEKGILRSVDEEHSLGKFCL